MPRVPRLFIGSSAESLEYAYALKSELGNDACADVWKTAIAPGQYTLAALTRMASESDFAVFVLGQDDVTYSRNKMEFSPRDNVVYEAGLFTGRLEVARVLLLVDARGCKIPTDYDGVSLLKYNPGSVPARDAVHEAAGKIRCLITDWRETAGASIEQQMLGYWWNFVGNTEEGAVIGLLSISPAVESSRWQVKGKAWTRTGKNIAEYWSRAVALDARDGKLFYYWEGRHPFDKSIPAFVGVAEIEFIRPRSGPISAARGWFSQSPLAELDRTVQKSTRYRRAEEQEVERYEANDTATLDSAIVDEWMKIRRAWTNGRPS